LRQIIHILSDLRNIPYENISKILRLPFERSLRPRKPEKVLSDYLESGWGGTCFSLNYLVIQALRTNGTDAWPVSVNTGRNTFPHYAILFSRYDKQYLIDPGYLLYSPLLLKERGADYGTNGVLDYELLMENGLYTLSSIDARHRKKRYVFSPNRVEDRVFIHHWIRSFDYISALVASRIVDNSILYINDDYVRFTDAHTVEKRYDKEKADEYLSKYFGFSREEVFRAREIILDSQKNNKIKKIADFNL